MRKTSQIRSVKPAGLSLLQITNLSLLRVSGKFCTAVSSTDSVAGTGSFEWDTPLNLRCPHLCFRHLPYNLSGPVTHAAASSAGWASGPVKTQRVLTTLQNHRVSTGVAGSSLSEQCASERAALDADGLACACSGMSSVWHTRAQRKSLV